MSKYFTDDNDISSLTEQLEPTESYATPIPNAVDVSYKEQISQQTPIETTAPTAPQKPTTVEEHIAAINTQNKQVDNAMKKISEQTAKEIENTFETIAPLELFERMNQLTFLMVQMNNKLTAIETILSEGVDLNTKNITVPKAEPEVKLTPKEQYLQETTKEMTPLEEAHNQLKTGMEAHGNGLPTDGYTGAGTNLEKMFPNMPEEAYQAAYQGMNDEQALKSGGKGIVF